MKKVFAVIMAAVMLLSMAACAPAEPGEDPAQIVERISDTGTDDAR